jgi:hypothetical protein
VKIAVEGWWLEDCSDRVSNLGQVPSTFRGGVGGVNARLPAITWPLWGLIGRGEAEACDAVGEGGGEQSKEGPSFLAPMIGVGQDCTVTQQGLRGSNEVRE